MLVFIAPWKIFLYILLALPVHSNTSAVKRETRQLIIVKGNHRTRKTFRLWHTAKTIEADNTFPLPRQYNILINKHLFSTFSILWNIHFSRSNLTFMRITLYFQIFNVSFSIFIFFLSVEDSRPAAARKLMFSVILLP